MQQKSAFCTQKSKCEYYKFASLPSPATELGFDLWKLAVFHLFELLRLRQYEVPADPLPLSCNCTSAQNTNTNKSTRCYHLLQLSCYPPNKFSAGLLSIFNLYWHPEFQEHLFTVGVGKKKKCKDTRLWHFGIVPGCGILALYQVVASKCFHS